MSDTVSKTRPEARSLFDAQYEDWIIHQAIELLERRVFSTEPVLTNADAVRDFLRLKLVPEPNEVFAVIFLNTQHQVIAYEPLFKGTIDQCAAYPRVVVQRVIAHNAAAVILSHQHPSGTTEPSASDWKFTKQLQSALITIGVRVLDHLIVGQGNSYSFAQAGVL